jgi:phosphoglycerate dehydrogenase-like enzyme
MTTTTILVPAAEHADLVAALPNVRLVTYAPGTPLANEGKIAEIIVVGGTSVDQLQPILAELPNLRMIQTLNAGVNHWAGYVREGVILSNARGAHGAATAELAASMLLAIYRDFPRYFGAQLEHHWATTEGESMVGKRILVLGAGDLARQLERRLVAFDATVTLVGRSARDGVRGMDELPALLPESDAVVLMLPLRGETEHLVDAGFLARMADNAILVNVARGPIVDTDALIAELESGRLRAALDVTDPEPLPADHPLWDVPNLFVTPHVGGNTTGSQVRAWSVVRDQIAQFLAGQTPANAFDPNDIG